MLIENLRENSLFGLAPFLLGSVKHMSNSSIVISAPVGSTPRSLNSRTDVETIQRLLNQHVSRLGIIPLAVNGQVSPGMILAIQAFQRQIVGLSVPDGRVDPGGITLKKLVQPAGGIETVSKFRYPGIYSHPRASDIRLVYGSNAVKLNAKAEELLKSILASCGIPSATLNSTLRSYHDQARITVT